MSLKSQSLPGLPTLSSSSASFFPSSDLVGVGFGDSGFDSASLISSKWLFRLLADVVVDVVVGNRPPFMTEHILEPSDLV